MEHLILQEEDYPGAIQLCLECQKAASTFKHYNCIRWVENRWLDLWEIQILKFTKW